MTRSLLSQKGYLVSSSFWGTSQSIFGLTQLRQIFNIIIKYTIKFSYQKFRELTESPFIWISEEGFNTTNISYETLYKSKIGKTTFV